MNWTGCDVVEEVPGKVSGRPVIRGTRVLAEAIVEDAALGSGMAELRESYPAVPEETILEVLRFARSFSDLQLQR